MALKKSELYSSPGQSCDKLRGAMKASQHKDYLLVLLFAKYLSDKYAIQPFPPIEVPPSASFAGMVALTPGVLPLRSRAALAGYLRRWSIDCSSDYSLDPALHHLWLRNPQTLYGVESAVFAPGAKEGGSLGPL